MRSLVPPVRCSAAFAVAAVLLGAVVAVVAACKPANMSGNGGKKSGSRDEAGGGGQELGSSAPGESGESGMQTGDGETTATTSGTGTHSGEYNDSPVTIPASMSGAFLICPMVDATGRAEVGDDEDMFGCAATPDGKDLLPLDDFDIVWRVDDAAGDALAATQFAPPARSLFHRLFVLDKTKINATTRVRAAVVSRKTALKVEEIEGLVLPDKRAQFPQVGDADKDTPCSVCDHQHGSGSGTGGNP